MGALNKQVVTTRIERDPTKGGAVALTLAFEAILFATVLACQRRRPSPARE
jgi:hypothetical protein